MPTGDNRGIDQRKVKLETLEAKIIWKNDEPENNFEVEKVLFKNL